MKIEKVKINKDLATLYLSKNTNNRKKRDSIVSRYANEMLNGRWKNETGELIKISKTGVLLDGQHRLYAIQKANIEIEMYVAFDLEDSIFDVIDVGAKRSNSDIFKIHGALYSSQIPAMINVGCKLDNGTISTNRNFMTSQELLNIFKEDEQKYLSIAKRSNYLYNKFAKVLPCAFIGGLIIHFNKISTVDCENFFDELCSGQNVTNNSIYLLRNKLIENRTSVKKMDNSYIFALIIKTWNFYRTNTQVNVLKYSKDIERNFPVAI